MAEAAGTVEERAGRVVSLSPLTVLPCSPLEEIQAAADAGFTTLGLRLNPVMDTDVDVLGDAALMRDIERALADTGLRVFDFEVIRIDPSSDIDSLRPVLEFGGRVGASTMLVTSASAEDWRADEEAEVTRKLDELCSAAAPFGIRPMLEFMVFRGVGRLEDAVRIATAIGHERIGVCVDALHLSRSGGTPAEVAEVDPRLLSCVQLCDAPAEVPSRQEIPLEARYNRLYPGEGGLPLAELLAAVPADTPVSLEAPNRARAGRSVLDRAEEVLQAAAPLLTPASVAL